MLHIYYYDDEKTIRYLNENVVKKIVKEMIPSGCNTANITEYIKLGGYNKKQEQRNHYYHKLNSLSYHRI